MVASKRGHVILDRGDADVDRGFSVAFVIFGVIADLDVDRNQQVSSDPAAVGRILTCVDEARAGSIGGRGKAMPARDDSTSSTLLRRLALSPPDEAAWGEFVERYGPRIFQWCRGWGLQEADILDVSQAVLVRLSIRLRRFEYDRSRSFRAWLRSVVRNAVQDGLTGRGPAVGAGTTDMIERLASVEARDDLARRLEQEFDLELLEVAIAIVRARVAPKSWEAYELTTREGLSPAEVARRLGMRVGTVYQARSRVTQMLQEEVRRLEGDPSERSPD